MAMITIEDQRFDAERALYGSRDVALCHCAFAGPADGESALKESAGITARDCLFDLRYPLWHVDGFALEGCEMTQLCRAALWYSRGGDIRASKLHGIKALRECRDIKLADCDVISPEFGWSSQGVSMERCTAQSEYFMLRAADLTLRDVTFTGKYSFQYVENVLIENCVLDTKDAFWHAKNVTVRDSVVKGEYLAWYSEGLTLDHCKIIGTQPLCYCRGLQLIDCEMEGADLAFERSEVEATLTTFVDSVKNPRAGHIYLPDLGELILDDPLAKGEVVRSGVAVRS